jgi:glycosyltransferase involved in cell wall biosynthesis
MKILMLLFGRRQEGTYYRAFPWARILAARGHEVTVACTSRNRLLRSRVEMDSGVRILETPSFLDGRFIMARISGMYGWSPLSIALRTQEIIRGHYDIVHTFEHHMHVALPVYLAGRKHIPRLIADWCDHYGAGGFREQLYSPYRLAAVYRVMGHPFRCLMDHVEKDLRFRADALTVISSFFQKRAVAMGIPLEKIFLIPGSADTQTVTPIPQAVARKRLKLDPSARVVAFLGAGQFDVSFSLEAFKFVLQREPNSLYLILGPTDELVRQKIREMNIANKVIQTGWIRDEDLPYYLGSADVGLIAMRDHPVNQARWPNKIGSYMAAGRPTVCTRVSDVARLVESKQIGLVSDIRTEDFAAKILALLHNQPLREQMGQRARRIAETEFTLETQVEELERAYNFMGRTCHAA